MISAAAVWEIAIKASIGRLTLGARDVGRLPRWIDACGFDELPILARHAAAVHVCSSASGPAWPSLPILARHAAAVHALPWHHRDPFDRLMIAQAHTESLTLVTVDPAMRAYELAVL